MTTGEIIGIAAIVVVPFVAWAGYALNQRKKRQAFFKLEAKKSSKLIPADILDIRALPQFGYDDYYYERGIDPIIRKKITARENVLILGRPLAGKSRAVLEALTKLNPVADVYIPAIDDIKRIDLQQPPAIGGLTHSILFLDDIDKYASKENFGDFLRLYVKVGFIVVATCRSGEEYDIFCKRMEQERVIFGDPVEIGKVSPEEAKPVAKKTGHTISEHFDGTLGSIFLALDTMKQRYAAAPSTEKTVIEVIKRLYHAGMYSDREVFEIRHIKRACAGLKELELKKHEWEDYLFPSLINKAFIEQSSPDQIKMEEVYLQQIIPDSFDQPADLKKTADIFVDDFDALFKIANRASELGEASLEKARYEELCIVVYQTCLRLRPLEKYPEDYGVVQNVLGNAYCSLGNIEDKADNCRKAIAAHTEALKVKTLDRFPTDYAITQHSLGNAYNRLADVEDKAKNCRNAIAAYIEALTVRTTGQFPIDCAMTQNNLGAAYLMLAGVEDKANNSRKAIVACTDALKVSTIDLFPIQYAQTQNNLGIAYRTLGQVEDIADNCQKAIAAYTEALKVRKIDHFPIDYAQTQNNLGNAYGTLAEAEDKADNCRAAIAAYTEALKVSTSDHFPMDYAQTQNNLGAAFRRRAEVEDKADNCRDAIAAYTKALKFYTLENLPFQYAMTQYNLGNAYSTLAEVDDKAANCRAAIAAYTEALKVYTLDRFPMDYAMTQYNLAVLYITMASESDKQGNCQKARDALKEALKVYTLDKLPQDHQDVLRVLADLDDFCKQE